MGTSSAFYTFVSKRKRSGKFYSYYFLWLGIQFFIVLSLIAFIFPDMWRNKIWIGQSKGMIILAFIASFIMDKVWQTVTSAGESIRATVIVQLHNVVVVGLYLCIIITTALLHRLTIPNLFIIISFTYLLLTFILAKKLKDSLFIKEEIRLRNIINEFKAYCFPLIIYGIVASVYSFADVWLLQKFSGSVQQGFYSVSVRFSAICSIATISMLTVFWKEISEANELGNKARLYQLYIKTTRALYSVGAAGACFLIPFSKELLVFFMGSKYEAGWFCLVVMFLHPIHESLGQIISSYVYATEQTRLYTKVGIITMICSIFVSYFVLAPRTAKIPGLALGSVGLALKMVILQIITINLLAYFICKKEKWRFSFLYQFEIIGLLLIASFLIKGFFSNIFYLLGIPLYPMLNMVFSLPLYILVVGLIVYLFPNLSGLERKQITNSIQSLYGFLRVKHS